jgi:hypothetical protein
VAGAIFDFLHSGDGPSFTMRNSDARSPLPCALADFREPHGTRRAWGIQSADSRREILRQLTVTKSMQPHAYGRVDPHQAWCAFAGRRECGLHVHPVQIDCTISQDITEVLE